MKFSSTDCLIIIIGMSLILNVLMLIFYLRLKKMIESILNFSKTFAEIENLSNKCSQLNQEFEKVAIIRIAELEDKITKLKELISDSDIKLSEFLSLREEIERLINEFQKNNFKNFNQQLIDSELITKIRLNVKPDILGVESRMVTKIKEECEKVYSDLLNKIEDIKIKFELLQTQNCLENTINTKTIAFINEPKINDYVIPQNHTLINPNIKEKYAEVYKLADQGMDANKISEITKVEKRTINLLLNLRKKN